MLSSVISALAELAEPAPLTLADKLATTLDVGDRFLHIEGLYVAFSEKGISLVQLTEDEAEFRRAFAARFGPRPLRPGTTPPPGLRPALAGKSAAASAGARQLSYDLSTLSPFQQAVLRKTAEIPRGEIRPYAWVAREVGRPAAVRAVGTALAHNPVPVLIPCHRVVRSDGRIGNYGFGTAVKERLLIEEGVDLAEIVALAASGVRYVGSATTSIYCLPTCHAARRIQPTNRRTFPSTAKAHDAGYRPCQHCRPAAPATAA